jgi:glycine cleavage system H protein
MVKVGDYEVRDGLYYSKDFFWVKVEGTKARCGVSDYAQKMLRAIVYADAPKEGTDLKQNEVCGSVESIKAVSDLISPLNGKVVEYNKALDDNAGLINQDPFGKGWLFIAESPSMQADLAGLMDFNKAVQWHQAELAKK